MKRILISLCLPLLLCVFAFNSYADEVTIEYPSGIYTGEVSNGVPHGQGTFTYGKGAYFGDIYVGEFKYGKYDGQGTYTFGSGEKYVGEWKDGNPWKGTEYDKDGNVTATWTDGVMSEK